MNIGFLKTFIAVADTESFTRAARELGITQPAVSQHIRALEEQYKVRLFQRQAQKIRLTPEGEALRRKTRELFRALAEVKNCMENINDLRQGCVTIAVNTFMAYLISPVVMRFKNAYPGVRIKLCFYNTRDIVRLVSQGDADFGLAGALAGEPSNLHSIPVHDEPFVFAAPANHPLASLPSVKPEDLRDCVLVIREQGTYTRERIVSWFAGTSFPPSLIETNNMESTHQLVLAGAVAFLPERAILEDIRMGTLCKLQAQDLGPSMEYSLFTQQPSVSGLAARTFLKMFAESGLVSRGEAVLSLVREDL